MQKVINFTEAALKFLKESMVDQDCIGYRVEIVSGGCSGMTYEINYTTEQKDGDLLLEEDGLKIFVAPKAVMFVSGMIVDYNKTPMGGNLVFKNPNALSQCSCGKSFSVDSSPCCSNTGSCCS